MAISRSRLMSYAAYEVLASIWRLAAGTYYETSALPSRRARTVATSPDLTACCTWSPLCQLQPPRRDDDESIPRLELWGHFMKFRHRGCNV
jgi:hypothetical protein